MSVVLGLVFKSINDIHYTAYTGDLSFELDDLVIARTVRSKEIGRIIQIKEELPKREGEPFVRKVIRKATEKDFQREEANRERERKAFSIAVKKIEKLGLPMTLIRVHYLFDHSRILFYFKAAGKVDFRQLVRELASVFKARIELRQIGVRDEAKMLGGIATCGRMLCCTTWLRSFTPVTVRMAKDQHLSLNPNKISGLCGRLQCCLEYEQKFYEETLKGVPNMGSQVKTPEGDGKLIKANIFTGIGSVLMQDSTIINVNLDEVERKPRSNSGHQKNRRNKHRDNRRPEGEDSERKEEAAKTEKKDEAERKDEVTESHDKSSRDSRSSEESDEDNNKRRNNRRRRRRGKRRDNDGSNDKNEGSVPPPKDNDERGNKSNHGGKQ